ncbi:MAG: HD domain-containing protein [Proteobacteria bacterium]|nr:HD domain-containing protein [Pseudomonadota bacterium]
MPDTDPSLEKLIFNLNTLSELGTEITSANDFKRIVKSSLLMVMGSFSASKGVLYTYDAERLVFSPIASKGLTEPAGGLRLSESAMRGLAEHSRPVDIGSGQSAVAHLGQASERFRRLGLKVVAFLVVRDELLGMIVINEKLGGEAYSSYDLQLLSVMAQNIAFSLQSHSLLKKLMHKFNENKELYENLRRIYYDTIHAFAAAIDAKDAYTKGHSHRVATYCAVVATELGWSDERIEGIRIAGLLHDIGKIAVDRTIINKPSSLSGHECVEINAHPVVGYEILSKIKFPWKGIPFMTRNHHEKIDGTGYPDRLAGDEISQGARIMTLVDAFDAMTTDRPYRRRLSFTVAMGELKKHSSTQFDPDIVHSFVSVLKKEASGRADRTTILPLLDEKLDNRAVSDFLKATF